MKFFSFSISILTISIFFISNANSQTLVWADEFNGTAIDTVSWNFETGNGCAQGICGWGNSELQYYTNSSDNAYVANGDLVIKARNQSIGGNSFTSARLKTQGKVHFKYGTLEARIKIPDLQNGLWPAFWLLGATGGWPANGEIDVAEWGSSDAISSNVVNKRVSGACHWDSFGNYAFYGTHTDFSTDLNDDYHIYKLIWTDQSIKCFVDGNLYYNIDITNPNNSSLEEFHNMKYILLNLAVGGSFTGIFNTSGITAPLPAEMKIDYLRLYQDASGELFTGLVLPNLECGNYGVYTEADFVSDHINYATEANLYVWNGLTNTAATAYEGSEVLSFTTNAGNWFGFGTALNEAKNMENYSDGFLKFHLKTNANTNLSVGLNTNGTDSWLNLNTSYGYNNDNNWNEISIPISDFNASDLAFVNQIFMFSGDVPNSNFSIQIDNVYWQDDISCVCGENPNDFTDNIWIGSTNGNWHDDSSDWSLGEFPDYCHNVIINNGYNITVQNTKVAKAYSLQVNQGASLDVNIGATMNIIVGE